MCQTPAASGALALSAVSPPSLSRQPLCSPHSRTSRDQEQRRGCRSSRWTLEPVRCKATAAPHTGQQKPGPQGPGPTVVVRPYSSPTAAALQEKLGFALRVPLGSLPFASMSGLPDVQMWCVVCVAAARPRPRISSRATTHLCISFSRNKNMFPASFKPSVPVLFCF